MHPREDAKRGPRVPHVRDIEKARDDRDDIISADMRIDKMLRALVQEQNDAYDRYYPVVFILHSSPNICDP